MTSRQQFGQACAQLREYLGVRQLGYTFSADLIFVSDFLPLHTTCNCGGLDQSAGAATQQRRLMSCSSHLSRHTKLFASLIRICGLRSGHRKLSREVWSFTLPLFENRVTYLRDPLTKLVQRMQSSISKCTRIRKAMRQVQPLSGNFTK